MAKPKSKSGSTNRMANGVGFGRSGGSKKKGTGRPPNMFILYFLDMYRKHGGNMYCVAKVCGRKWKTLPQAEKEKYRRQYCSKCKSCGVCTRSSPKKK